MAKSQLLGNAGSTAASKPTAQSRAAHLKRAKPALWRDYLTMTKPKVVAMLLLTALVGMCLAVPGIPPAKAVVLGLMGIGFQSAAAAV